jgi:hypothetical protein
MPKRVCIITAGHLATCPRMLKAADALHEAGYDVRVVSASYIQWAQEADRQIRQTRNWQWSAFEYEKSRAPFQYYKIAVRFHLARRLARSLDAGKLGFNVQASAFSRTHSELVKLAVQSPVDFFYGGTSGGIAVAAEAARRLGVPFALDLEDFHSAEQEAGPNSHLAHSLIAQIEKQILPRANFLTAGSGAIAEAYYSQYGVKPVVLNNVFPLPKPPPPLTTSSGSGLKLYWFSQTIGGGRGLEDVIRAVGLAAFPADLHLRGRPIPDYVDSLQTLAAEVAPRLKLHVHPPGAPDKMVELAQPFDIGLSTEPGFSLNNQLALSNKSFTYMLAGLAVVFTDTPGQRKLASDLGLGAVLCEPGDITALATGLKQWAENKATLARAKQAVWAAAQCRWHWEHPEERGTLLKMVGRIVTPNT